MLLRWDIENPGELIVMPTPSPTWEGVFYEDTFTLPTYKTGDLDAAALGTSASSDPSCGNSFLEAGEACDDGNGVPGDGCDGLCQIEGTVVDPFCGDGRIDAGEECDDGNVDSGDGCSSVCLVEAPVCGDGSVDAGEACDDGNMISGDGCDAFCQVEVPAAFCGDGNIDVDSGETCDDGDTIPGDGCDATCQVEVGTVEIVETAIVNKRGVLSAKGSVEAGLSVVADNAAVTCSTRANGGFSCKGTGLEPGTSVNILLVR